jgi:trimeric autotransporter adhesin
MLGRRVNHCLRLLLILVLVGASRLAMASEYHGQVTLAELPASGVTVTATQGDKKVVTVTDGQGLYTFPDLADGTWSIQVEMTGFTTLKQDVAVAPNAQPANFALKTMTLDQIRAEAKPLKVDNTAPVVSANTVAPPPAPAAKTPAAGTKTAENAPPPPPPTEDENAPKASDGLLINGSSNNAATSPFSQNQAFGNTRNGKSLYNGGFSLQLGNSALNASPYSLNGVVTPKPAYNDITAGFNFGGPIRIFNLWRPRAPNFFVGYQWTRNRNDSTVSGLLPDAAERTGNLSEIPVQIFNPATGQPYSGNIVPVSAQALALLALFPQPNATGNSRYNYQTDVVSNTHQDALSLRLNNLSIGSKNQFNGGFAIQSTRSNTPNLFGFDDTSDVLGLNSNVNYMRRFHTRLFLTAGYTFSRSRSHSIPYFAGRTNFCTADQICGGDQNPLYWGPPSLSFSDGHYGLSDGQSSYNRSETNRMTANFAWNRTHHTVTFGGEFRRQEFNYLSEQSPRGSFSFTGAATGGPGSTGGSALADFLIGDPDTSGIAYGNADKYLRQNVYALLGDDDWRVKPELTVHVGFRWEYGAPITELKNRLVNLDEAANFAGVAPVLANSPVGSLTSQHYPSSLLRPDRLGLEPRVGISWRPISGSSVLVKAGYGIYDDTSVYQATALAMAQQAPLSTSLNVQNVFTNGIPCNTLASGFNPCGTSLASLDTFGVDPNFRVGYAQNWQLSVQRDLPFSLQLTATYNGIKGTRGVQQFLPNTYALGESNPCPSCPSGFTYRTSNGNSTRESGNVQLRRRLRSGLTATLTYTYSKSIDDDAVLGGQGPLAAGAVSQSSGSANIAQNWQNLRAERGLSSFDQRNLLNVNVQYTTGMGLGGHSLMGGWKGAAFKEWTVIGTVVSGSGLPETPYYASAIPGGTCTNCIRPNVTGTSISSSTPGVHLNAAAFTAPLAGQFGNARVESITGPDQFTFNASLDRIFRFKGRYNLETRADITNVLNHVTFPGWYTGLNPVTCTSSSPTLCNPNQPFSPTLNPEFGVPSTANAMRSMQITARLRF